MGARIRAHDWLATPFGSPATWPQSLRLAVSMMLGSSFGTAIYWGPDLRLLYNDAWAAQTAVKPSETLGRPAAEVWADIWRIIGPRISRTFETGEGISDHDRMLPLRRGGTVTETWWTYSLTPIRETDGAVSGLFNQADETTGRVLSRRRDAFLLDLDDLLSVAGDPVDAVRIAVERLGREVRAARVGIGVTGPGGRVVVEHDWTAPGSDTASGRYDLADFLLRAADLREGRTGRVYDVADGAASIPLSARRLCERLNVRAVVEAPVLRNGRLAAALFVHDDKPRSWTDTEAQLVEAAAERAWSAIERASAETALRESEQRLRALVEASSDFMYRLSPDLTEMRDLTGGFVDGAAAPNRNWLQTYIDPADRPLVHKAIAEAIRTEGPVELEHRVRRVDATMGWVHSRTVPIFGASGEIAEWIGMATDITRQKRAREERERLLDEVRAERDRLSALLASMQDEVWFADRDKQITLVNPAALEEFGLDKAETFSIEDVIGSVEILRLDGSPRPLEESPSLRALKGETVFGWEEMVRTPAKRELRYRQQNAAPVRDSAGAIIGSVAVVRDVTERRRSEAALRVSEAFLRELADSMPQLVWITNSEMQVTYYNARAAEYGLVADGNGHYKWMPMVHPEDLGATIEAWGEAVGRGVDYEKEHRLLVADRGYRWHLSRGRPQRDGTGAIVRWFGTATDIHDLKVAETSLRESEARFRAMFENAAVGMTHTARNGRFLSVNGRFCAILGYSAEELVARTFHDVTHPDDLESDLAEVRRMLAGCIDTFSMEKRFVREDGTAVWCNLTVGCVRDAGGALNSFISVVEDISARRAAEQALRESEERKAFMLKLSDALRRLSDATEIEATATRLLGVALRADRVYFGPFDLEAGTFSIRSEYIRDGDPSHAGDYPYRDFPELIRVLEAGESFVVPDVQASTLFPARTKQFYAEFGFAAIVTAPLIKAGRLVWRLTASSKTPRAWTKQEVALVREVGERCWDAVQRARAEASLHESEERLRVSFAHASIGFCLSRPDGRILDANPAYCASIGYSLEELRDHAFTRLVHPEDLAANMALQEKMLAGHIPGFVIENRHVRKGGDIIWVRKSVSLVHCADGAPRWITALVEDVTARIEAEAALREADRRKDEFLATLAHELRNPLAPIRNGLEVLKLAGADSAKAARVRDMMARQTDHLVRLVDDLLEVSRISRGLIELRKEEIDLAQVVVTRSTPPGR